MFKDYIILGKLCLTEVDQQQHAHFSELSNKALLEAEKGTLTNICVSFNVSSLF